MLADSRTDPADAALVDASADARAWASSLGVRPFASLPEVVVALG